MPGTGDVTMKVLKMKFGTGGEATDAFGIRFYGDMDGEIGRLGRIGEMFSDPGASPMIRHRRVTLWFTFQKIRPYERGSFLLGELIVRLRGAGYTVVTSSLDDLVDTTASAYAGTPEGRFPPSDRMHGYNAIGGLSVTAEKTDGRMAFTVAEIETVRDLAVAFGRIVYGRSLIKSF